MTMFNSLCHVLCFSGTLFFCAMRVPVLPARYLDSRASWVIVCLCSISNQVDKQSELPGSQCLHVPMLLCCFQSVYLNHVALIHSNSCESMQHSRLLPQRWSRPKVESFTASCVQWQCCNAGHRAPYLVHPGASNHTTPLRQNAFGSITGRWHHIPFQRSPGLYPTAVSGSACSSEAAAHGGLIATFKSAASEVP
jgi:hypothetical protein